MDCLSALKIVYKNSNRMARPVIGKQYPGYDDGIYFDPVHSWMWASGRKAGLPIPLLLFGEWEVVDTSWGLQNKKES